MSCAGERSSSIHSIIKSRSSRVDRRAEDLDDDRTTGAATVAATTGLRALVDLLFTILTGSEEEIELQIQYHVTAEIAEDMSIVKCPNIVIVTGMAHFLLVMA